MTHPAENDALTEAIIERLNDAFVEANRAEFMDTDFDLPILRTLVSLLSAAWHEGYGAGSSNATDGWLSPGSPRATNPYSRVIPPKEGDR
jgi:hypothetical protein